MADTTPEHHLALLGHLVIAHLAGEVPGEFDEVGQALGVLDNHHGKEGP